MGLAAGTRSSGGALDMTPRRYTLRALVVVTAVAVAGLAVGAQLFVDAHVLALLRNFGSLEPAGRGHSYWPGWLRFDTYDTGIGGVHLRDITATLWPIRRRCDGSPELGLGLHLKATRVLAPARASATRVCADVAVDGSTVPAIQWAAVGAGELKIESECPIQVSDANISWSVSEELRVGGSVDWPTSCPWLEGLPSFEKVLVDARLIHPGIGSDLLALLRPPTEGSGAPTRTRIARGMRILERMEGVVHLAAESAGGIVSACAAKEGAKPATAFELGLGLHPDQLPSFDGEMRALLSQVAAPDPECSVGGAAAGIRWTSDLALVSVRGDAVEPIQAARAPGQQIARVSCSDASLCSYFLAFIEFDDAGNLVDPAQVEALINLIRANVPNGVLVPTFMHGWQHSAAPADEYIARFAEIVEAAAIMEAQSKQRIPKSRRTVIGVYLGWRGRVYNEDLVNSVTTFWDRLAVADQIGRDNGPLQRLLECLSAEIHATAPDATKTDFRSALIITGHSMGARAVFGATSSALVKDLDVGTPGGRFGDLVLLINPAFSAEQYEAMHRVSRQRTASRTPLVLLSSVADGVTRALYPAGAAFSFADAESDDFTRYVTTAPNHDPFITHRLRLVPTNGDKVSIRRGEHTIVSGVRRVPKQARQAGELFDYRDATVYRPPHRRENAWYRLVLCSHDPNADDRDQACDSPVSPREQLPAAMVVQVDEAIIPNHGDIFTAPLMEYVVRLVNFQLRHRGVGDGPAVGPQSNCLPSLQSSLP